MIYEVKSAIILAAGRGKRLNDLTNDVPKPLLKVNGEVLIERLITQLQEKGIESIYIVTGYKHLMFAYLEEKYGVELIYNKKWFCTNNIMSFIKGYEDRSRCASTAGTMILDADLYINNTDIIQTKIDSSGYYLEYCDNAERCKKEWVADICGAAVRRINRVITDGSKDSGYILRSLSFWTPIDTQKLYSFAKDAIKDGLNMQRYIDDVPCVMYHDKFDLHAYVAEKGSLFEIDTLLDYKQVNKGETDEQV